MRWKPNPSRTDLLKAMMKHEANCDLKDLVEKISNEYETDKLSDFLQRKNLNNKYNDTIE